LIKKVATFILTIILSSLTFIGFSQDIRIDHVITVVADLDSAIKAYEELGFTIKQGRLHENGLINAHIKFKNNTAVELMSIKGEPTDELARNYADLLKHGEGGVFLAFSGIETAEMARRLHELEIEYITLPGKNWDYITFAQNSSLAHIFFIDYHIKTNDSLKILTHNNSAKGIKAIWLEGDEKVKRLLENLGLKPVHIRSDNKIGAGQGYLATAGNIIILPRKNPDQRPRIKAISFGREDNDEIFIIRY
jgi:hypothetical protein